MAQPLRGLEHLDSLQVDDAENKDFPLEGLDLVIMNPPYTDNAKRSRKFGPETIAAMQKREIFIRDHVTIQDLQAGSLITTNSIRTFFTPLAERFLDKRDGTTLATVMPTTACIGASGYEERRFIADRFYVELVVTTHDPRRINFSENTSIHESLLVCRRRSKEMREDTKFVSLRKMPATPEEAVEIADSISAGRCADLGNQIVWPRQLIEAGNWSPAQWYNGELAWVIEKLEKLESLKPLGSLFSLGALGQAIRSKKNWIKCEDGNHPGSVKMFDSVSSKLRRKMAAAPERWVRPGPKPWKDTALKSGNLMLAARMDTQSGRLSALYSEEPAFGSGWIPVTHTEGHVGKALCAWWNSTPARLLLFNRRSRKLTYPNWSADHLRSVGVPKEIRRDSPTRRMLAAAWEETSQMELAEMRDGPVDPARRRLDEAAATAAGLDPAEVAQWCEMLSLEPTVRGRSTEE